MRMNQRFSDFGLLSQFRREKVLCIIKINNFCALAFRIEQEKNY
jgi:hypothetical protein